MDLAVTMTVTYLKHFPVLWCTINIPSHYTVVAILKVINVTLAKLQYCCQVEQPYKNSQ